MESAPKSSSEARQLIDSKRLLLPRWERELAERIKDAEEAQRLLKEFDQRLRRLWSRPAEPIKARREELAEIALTATKAKANAEYRLVREREEIASLEETEKQYRKMGL